MGMAIDEEIVHRTTVRLTPKGVERLASLKAQTRLNTRRIIEHGLLLYVRQMKRKAAEARREE